MVLPVCENPIEFLSLPESSKERRIFSFLECRSSPVFPLKLKQLSKILNNRTSPRPPLPEDDLPHNGKVNEVFNAMRYILLALGRFPFTPSHPFEKGLGRNSPEDGRSPENYEFFKGMNYSSSIKSFAWLYFGITSLLLAILLVLSVAFFLEVFLAWTFFGAPKWSPDQKSEFQKNLIPFVLVCSCLLSSSVGNVSFLLNRRNIAKFLNYWNVAVDNMRVGIPPDLSRFLHMSNLWFLIFAGLMLVSATVL